MNYGFMRERWDRVLAVVSAVVGIIVLIVGWVGVSGSSLTTEQIPYLASGAVGGLFALGAAATLWLSADLRDEFVKLDEIYQWMRGEGDGQPAHGEMPTGEMPATDRHGSWAPEVEAHPAELQPAEAQRAEAPAASARRRPLRARPPVSSVES
jgi:hypothetical protein